LFLFLIGCSLYLGELPLLCRPTSHHWKGVLYDEKNNVIRNQGEAH
jgi:hypothetical protein